jgi:hypothetical protein
MNSKLSLMRATHYKSTYFTGAELKLDLKLDFDYPSLLSGVGGGKRTRTADVLLAKQALYQLSYTPIPS